MGENFFHHKFTLTFLATVGMFYFHHLFLVKQLVLWIADLFFSHSDNPSDRFKRLSNLIMKSFSTLPSCVQNPFTILYCSRLNESLKSTFELYRLDWSHKNGWKTSQPELPSHSDLILSLGSGKESILASHLNWQKTEVKGTSRSVFSAFCDSLESGQDPLSGGAPQLVGIYRKGAARSFGIIFNDQKYLLGLPVENENLKSVEWRNHLFEESDPNTNQRQTNAQPQPRPKSLGK